MPILRRTVRVVRAAFYSCGVVDDVERKIKLRFFSVVAYKSRSRRRYRFLLFH
jgi:hypothetical protein